MLKNLVGLRGAAAGVVILAAGTFASAGSTVSYVSGTYTQNFDSLPDPGATSVNTANPVTINATSYSLPDIFDFANAIDTSGVGHTSTTGGLGLSATMSGWYGAGTTGAGTGSKFGATDGDQTTGGVLSFGPPSSANRALGLIATSTSGATYFGVNITNATGQAISTINLAFTGEYWKQGTLSKTLNYGYTVDNASTFTLVSAATDATAVTLGSITNPSTGAVGAIDGTQAANQVPVNITSQALSTAVNSGGTLWLWWDITNAGGSGQGYGIDNLSFSAAAPVPEPATLGLVGLGLGSLLVRRRRCPSL